MAASIHGRLDVVESLIQAGADVDKAANDGITAPMLASEQGHGAIVQAPFQAGADVDKAANDGIDTLYRVANFFCHTNIQINIPLNPLVCLPPRPVQGSPTNISRSKRYISISKMDFRIFHVDYRLIHSRRRKSSRAWLLWTIMIFLELMPVHLTCSTWRLDRSV